jgi:hypothetical protein
MGQVHETLLPPAFCELLASAAMLTTYADWLGLPTLGGMHCLEAGQAVLST